MLVSASSVGSLEDSNQTNNISVYHPSCRSKALKRCNKESEKVEGDTTSPSSRFDLKGAFLYWYSNQSGMGYTTRPQSTFTTSDFSDGTLVDPNYDWEPGFRVDAAYGFDKSYWAVAADYVWYHGKGSGSRSTKDTNGMFPAFSFSDSTVSTDYVNSASIDWKLHAMWCDVLTSYEWVCNSYFKLMPTLGVRNIWLKEKAHVDYDGGTFAAGTDVVHLKSKFYGVGPRLALRPEVVFGKGFSFYAEGGGDAFYGWFKVNQSEKFLDTTIASVHRKVSGFRYGVDTTAGFVYTYDISKKTNFSIDLGFDYLVFFKQNEFKNNSATDSQGSALTLYGAHGAVGFRF